MTGLLICAAVLTWNGTLAARQRDKAQAVVLFTLGLALIAVALWLAYAAGGA